MIHFCKERGKKKTLNKATSKQMCERKGKSQLVSINQAKQSSEGLGVSAAWFLQSAILALKRWQPCWSPWTMAVTQRHSSRNTCWASFDILPSGRGVLRFFLRIESTVAEAYLIMCSRVFPSKKNPVHPAFPGASDLKRREQVSGSHALWFCLLAKALDQPRSLCLGSEGASD